MSADVAQKSQDQSQCSSPLTYIPSLALRDIKNSNNKNSLNSAPLLKPILKMLHTLTLEAKIKSNFQKDQIKCWFLKNAKIDF